MWIAIVTCAAGVACVLGQSQVQLGDRYATERECIVTSEKALAAVVTRPTDYVVRCSHEQR